MQRQLFSPVGVQGLPLELRKTRLPFCHVIRCLTRAAISEQTGITRSCFVLLPVLCSLAETAKPSGRPSFRYGVFPVGRSLPAGSRCRSRPGSRRPVHGWRSRRWLLLLPCEVGLALPHGVGLETLDRVFLDHPQRNAVEDGPSDGLISHSSATVPIVGVEPLLDVQADQVRNRQVP